MTWADGVYGVWNWSKKQLKGVYNHHSGPCPKCIKQEGLLENTANSPVQAFDVVKTINPAPVSNVEFESMLLSPIIKVAGLSGAISIGLGAYGAHVMSVNSREATEEQKKAFEVANRNITGPLGI